MERQGAYKFQANANYRKTLRSKAVDVKRKQQRCEIMMNNRRIPLEEKNQTTEGAHATEKVIEKGAGNVNRLQRLKEWQEKRNAIREQEKKKQVKPFYAGSTNMGQANKPSLTISTTVSNKPVTRLQIKNAASKLSTAQHQQKQTAQGKAVSKKQQEGVKKVTKVDSKQRVVGKPSAKQKNPLPSKAKVVEQDKKNCNKVKQPPPAVAPSSTQQIDEAWMPSNRRTKKVVTKTTDFEEAFADKKPLSPFRFGAPANTASQSKPFTFSMKYKPNVFVNLSRGGSKQCAPPSPLCFRYKAAEDLMNTPQQQDNTEEVLPIEDSLATVKRNCFHDPSNSDPVIMAAQPPKDVLCHTDSGNVGDDSSDSSDNEQDNNSKSAGHCDNKESAVEEDKDVSLATEGSSAVIIAGVSGATSKIQEVQRFKDMHADTVAALTKHCDVWEKKADEMTSIAAEDNEDVLGQIRTAVGQAQLLVNKKLKQFFGLCQNAEEGTGERHTTPDDLQGFWDMVSRQIEDVQRKFLRLEELEKNGWVEQDAPKKKPMKKVRGPAKRKAEPEVSEEQKQRLAEQREKRAAARNRLKEMKAAAKRGNLGGDKEDKPMIVDDNVFEEFVSSVAVIELSTPKKKKGDNVDSCVLTQVRRSTRKTPNKYRRKSTVSRSSTSEENETPVLVQPNKALENTNLMFFDSPMPAQTSQSFYATGYDFSQYVTPPSPSETGCLRPTPCPMLSDDSLGQPDSQYSS